MPDVWGNVGGQIGPAGQDWLYRKGGQIHGPIPKEALVEKLKRGDINGKTPVAREGGEFHPLSQIASFSEDLEDVSYALGKKASSKLRRGLFLATLVIGGIGAGIGYYYKLEAQKRETKSQAEQAKYDKELKAKQAKIKKSLADGDKIGLVALVSFDAEKMEIGGGKKKPRGGPRPGPGKEKDAPMVSQCGRSQQQILGTLGKHIGKINFCVTDEKKRDAGKGLLPSTLRFSFVVTPTGKVIEFQILDRHYRTGPMKNCLVKTFRLVRYPGAGGSNCPVTLPIKIGN